jgi:hypothetical protein
MDNGDLRPPESYAVASCLGCGMLASALRQARAKERET